IIEVVPTIGDLDGDGAVDASDLAILLGSWGACPGCPADLNGDGVVGAFDLALVLGNWGPCE
ncbi:MAG: dockerin type I domain-containing protein, partial [Gammaproteobacteria bacterium]